MIPPTDTTTSDGAANGQPRGEATVTALLERAFIDHPGRSALRFGNRTLTYAELDELTGHLAAALAGRGIGPGDRIGVALDRSVELITCVVATLRAGAAYVPLDLSYPSERLTMMADLAALRMLVCVDADRHRFGTTAVDTATPSELEDAATASPTPPGARDTAYVVFTSGSTGTPKGVVMPHRALANLLMWQLARETFRHGARALQYSSISFDVSFQEVATTLSSGGELVLIADERRRDPRTLLDTLVEERIERLFLPYVALRSLVGAAVRLDRYPRTLREVITAGERLRVDDTLREFFEKLRDTTLDNQYGPSETHVVTAHLLTGDPTGWPELPPIGTAVANNRVELLDDEMRPVGTGQTGMLFVAGIGLADGYLGRDDLTAAAFVTDPASGERMYRTGDLAHVDDTGLIHYEGRVDDQVKIRGHRVEPGEVDAVATTLDGVDQCFTRMFHSPGGNAYLASYVIATPGESVEPRRIRDELRRRLPDHLVPAFVFEVDHVATAPSGKADLRSLPHPTDLVAATDVTYETETEAKLADVWSELLGFPTVDRDASFFDLGGDSLAAVTLFLAIQEDFGVDLPLATLSRAPTLAALARVVDDGGEDTASEFRSLQVLNPGDDSVPPLALVHGGAGNVLIFRELASRLGPDQPVYGFQWSGWDGRRGEETVEDMAATYVAELRRARPRGPYRLGGHCLGGLVAIEMARLLTEAGEVVEDPLVISDAPNLAARSYSRDEPEDDADDAARFAAMSRRLRDAIPTEWTHSDDSATATTHVGRATKAPPQRRGVAGLPVVGPMYVRLSRHRRTRAHVRRLKSQLIRLQIVALLRSGRAVPTHRRTAYCLMCTCGAAAGYRSPGYDGDVIYFRTETLRGRDMALEGWWSDVFMGFEELCGGSFEGHVVGGRHDDALRAPGVADLVRSGFIPDER